MRNKRTKRKFMIGRYLLYSFMIHAVVLSLLLMAPIHRGGEIPSFFGLFVYLEKGEKGAVGEQSSIGRDRKSEIRTEDDRDRKDLPEVPPSVKKETAESAEPAKIASLSEEAEERERREVPEKSAVPPLTAGGNSKEAASDAEKKEVSDLAEKERGKVAEEAASEKKPESMKETGQAKETAESPAEIVGQEIKETKSEALKGKEAPAAVKHGEESAQRTLHRDLDERASNETSSFFEIPWENPLMPLPESNLSESMTFEIKEPPPPSDEKSSERLLKAEEKGEGKSSATLTEKHAEKARKTVKARKSGKKPLSVKQGTTKKAAALREGKKRTYGKGEREKKAAETRGDETFQGPMPPLSEEKPALSLGSERADSLEGAFAGGGETGPKGDGAAIEADSKSSQGEHQAMEEAKSGGEEPAMGIPVAEPLLFKDIRIEILPKGAGVRGMVAHLFRKAYPVTQWKATGEKPQTVDSLEEKEEGGGDGKTGPKKVFSLAKAEKGIYTFNMMNKGESDVDIDIAFRLYEKGPKERFKEYRGVKLPPGAAVTYRFILPDAVFWDDEDYFSGSIEDSDSMTKFHYETGLTWKEGKDY